MMALTLPRILAGVPRSIAPAALLAANTVVPRFLMDAQAFAESDLPPVWTDSLDACRQAMQGWLQRQLGPLHCLNPRFALRLLSRDSEPYGAYLSQTPKPQDIGGVEVTWGEDEAGEWSVGAGLTALNRMAPGLGVIVLHVLRWQSGRVYPLFTPEIACDMASCLYWQGEEDEQEALYSACGDDTEAREAMREEMVCKSDLEAEYPSWARRWPHRLQLRQCVRLLRRNLKRPLEPAAKSIAADAMALAMLNIEDKFRVDSDCEFVGFGAVLSWEEGDLTTRLYDDMVNLAYQGEYCDVMGEVQVELDDPSGFGAWQQAMADRFEAIRLIDALIHGLSAGNWTWRSQP